MQRRSSNGVRGAKPLISYERHESFLIMLFVTLSGGLQDAYTYLTRGHVFANAQTGNIVLLMHYIVEWDGRMIISYLFPIISFALGIMVSESIRFRMEERGMKRWREVVLMLEMILLLIVGFMPENTAHYANALVSFSCAMQVQSFRKFHGRAYASTMCIGNLRSGMENLSAFMNTKDRAALINASHYFLVILAFALGAAAGSFLVSLFSLRAIWVSSFLLLISFLILHHERNA